MNLIVLVFSFLMLFSIFTVVRVQSYLDFTEVRRQYRMYMVDHERALIERHAQELYERYKGSSGEEKMKPPLNSRLDLLSLFSVEGVTTDKDQETLHVAEKLFNQLLDDAALGPQIIDAIRAFTRQVEYTPPKRYEDLKEMVLADQGGTVQEGWLDLLFGLRGQPKLSELATVTQRKNSSKHVSIYLAKRELLLAIFSDYPDFVEEIITRRNEIHRNDTGEAEYRKAQEEELKTLIGLHRYANYLDFRISGSTPPK